MGDVMKDNKNVLKMMIKHQISRDAMKKKKTMDRKWMTEY